MLRFERFEKSYDGQLIISADLHLPHGLYWLKGENGSGKTTLLKGIAGLIPFKGEITVHDTSIKKQSKEYRSIVNYAEAEPLYPDFLTGRELIKYYIGAKGGNETQVKELQEQLGVGSYIHNKVGTYSSGMAKKLSLILAFTGSPKLVLLDEPLITLDKASVAALQNIIREKYTAGTSILITSHQDISDEAVRTTPLVIEQRTLKMSIAQ
jgi:ABC-2 type transport system ATP-binding protein